MKSKIFIVVSIIFVVAVGVLGYGFFVFKDVLFVKDKFMDGTTINGIDVSGLNEQQATNVVQTHLDSKRNDIKITLNYQDKTWTLSGKDFEIDNHIVPYVENVFDYFNSGNLFQKKTKLDKLNGNKTFEIAYTEVFTGLDAKIDEIANQIDTPAVDAQVVFDANKKDPFTFTDEKVGVMVDREALKNNLDSALKTEAEVEIMVPTYEVLPTVEKADIENSVALRGTFSTSYASSSDDRKHNVRHALEAFNGMVVEPDAEVSFNETTGSRTAENGYKKANIILNGVYVEGTGGGVCQSSTTLYNALILADVEILEVNKHTLPSSYVWLAFDAMVSEGYSDLKFKNTTGDKLYIKTYSDTDNVYVEIYGKPFAEGERLERRVEFLGAIPHPGDRIIPDTNGEYSNKVTYKGEYLRLKYPREGYRAKGYMDRYIGDTLVESKLIRDETYQAQEGIIIEGTAEVTEGITLPPNTVQFIPPQSTTQVNESNVERKIESENPSSYNP